MFWSFLKPKFLKRSCRGGYRGGYREHLKLHARSRYSNRAVTLIKQSQTAVWLTYGAITFIYVIMYSLVIKTGYYCCDLFFAFYLQKCSPPPPFQTLHGSAPEVFDSFAVLYHSTNDTFNTMVHMKTKSCVL